MQCVRLRSEVNLGVGYSDDTQFGSSLSGRLEDSVRAVYTPLLHHAEKFGFATLLERSPSLLQQVVQSDAFAQIAEVDSSGNWQIRREMLFQDAGLVRPEQLLLMDAAAGRQVSAKLPADYWTAAHKLIADLESGLSVTSIASLHPNMKQLLERMATEGFLEEVEKNDPETDSSLQETDLTWIGHNSVLICSKTTRIVVDPLWFASSTEYPSEYQPLQLRDFGRIDAVLITHSHPDHFGPASLMRFPPDTHIVVPKVEAETILCHDMVLRLRELGFTKITSLSWGESLRIGDISINALPFYGEQPTDGLCVHPEIRNVGNTYRVQTPDFSTLLLADTGRDMKGNMRDVATEVRLRFGPTDCVFGGYRGWMLYPVHYLFSSVPQYLLFVPPTLWHARQQIMSTAEEALDLAERFGARYFVPYADGGAPWYWNIGLGPRLDEDAIEMPQFDPFPERLVAAAQQRSQAPQGELLRSSVEVLLLRPGDALKEIAGIPETVRREGHMWPYQDQTPQS